MKKILITGASGFVGKYLVNLLEGSYFIIGIDRHSNLPSTSNALYAQCDLLDKTSLVTVLEKHTPDIIIHLAGIAQTWSKEIHTLLEVNFLGTINLYQAIVDVREKTSFNPKILYISSSEVYGKTKNLEHIDEDQPLFPVNYYATSKAAADRASYQFSQFNNLQIAILRPFPHTGPGQKTGFFITDMASQIVQAERDENINQIMTGNLESIRDYLDVRDVVRAYQAILETENFPKGEAFNICSGKGYKMRELLEFMLSKAQKKLEVVKDPTRLRPSDIPIHIGTHHKLTQLTGWEPTYSIEDTMLDILEYWRKTN